MHQSALLYSRCQHQNEETITPDSVLLSDRSPLACSSTGVGKIGDCFAALEMAALCAALFTSVIGINRSCGTAKADRATAATGEEL